MPSNTGRIKKKQRRQGCLYSDWVIEVSFRLHLHVLIAFHIVFTLRLVCAFRENNRGGVPATVVASLMMASFRSPYLTSWSTATHKNYCFFGFQYSIYMSWILLESVSFFARLDSDFARGSSGARFKFRLSQLGLDSDRLVSLNYL